MKNILKYIRTFIENWIYPGYYLKNYFIYRYDLIKLPIKRYEFKEIDERLFLSMMILVDEYITNVSDQINVEHEIYNGYIEEFKGRKVRKLFLEIQSKYKDGTLFKDYDTRIKYMILVSELSKYMWC